MSSFLMLYIFFIDELDKCREKKKKIFFFRLPTGDDCLFSTSSAVPASSGAPQNTTSCLASFQTRLY